MVQNFFAKDDYMGGLNDEFFKEEMRKASLKLEKLNAYALYHKPWVTDKEQAVRETYPEHADFVLANIHLSYKEFTDLVSN
jgi:hypothetical protein